MPVPTMLATTMQVAVSNEMVLCLGEEEFERTGRSSSGSPGWIQTEKSEPDLAPGTTAVLLRDCTMIQKLTAS